MKTIYIWQAAFILLLSGISVNALLAADQPCKPILDEAEFLPEVRQAAFDFIEVIKCQSPNDQEAVAAYDSFLSALDGWFDRFGGFKGTISPVSRVRTILALGTERAVTIGLTLNDTLSIHGKQFSPADEGRCETVANTACGSVLDEFRKFFGDANRIYTLPEVEQTLGYHKALREEWDPFLTHMRSQTPIELGINGWWFKRKETDEFAPPPKMQWIVLHPIVLVEYMPDAQDGDQMDEAIGLELFGANWWEEREWYIPSGGSVLALYSDRPDIQDWGLGLAVHFNSIYTIGVADHDGDTSVFISADLLKLFQDKKSAFDAYH